jgi:hypothetical protein
VDRLQVRYESAAALRVTAKQGPLGAAGPYDGSSPVVFAAEFRGADGAQRAAALCGVPHEGAVIFSQVPPIFLSLVYWNLIGFPINGLSP